MITNQTALVGLESFEAPGVEPVFPKRMLSLSEIRIFDSRGNVERVIPFDDANRKL